MPAWKLGAAATIFSQGQRLLGATAAFKETEGRACVNRCGGGNVRTDRHVVHFREFGNATSARFFKPLRRTIRTK